MAEPDARPWCDIRREYGISALPENVFGTLTDPARLARWLPSDVDTHWDGPTAQVDLPSGEALQASARADELTVQLTAGNGDEQGAVIQIRDGGAGSSVVEVRLRWPRPSGGEDQLVRLLDVAADDLQSEVSENFTAG